MKSFIFQALSFFGTYGIVVTLITIFTALTLMCLGLQLVTEKLCA
jgi:hypothetical protein